MSPLAWTTSQLPLNDALQVWNKADAAERAELMPVLARKARNWMERAPRNATPAQVKAVLPTIQPFLNYHAPAPAPAPAPHPATSAAPSDWAILPQ